MEEKWEYFKEERGRTIKATGPDIALSIFYIVNIYILFLFLQFSRWSNVNENRVIVNKST